MTLVDVAPRDGFIFDELNFGFLVLLLRVFNAKNDVSEMNQCDDHNTYVGPIKTLMDA